MTKLMENKVAVITGAGSGIGRSAALKLARNGAKIALLINPSKKPIKFKRKLINLAVKHLVIQTDVSEISDVHHAFQKIYNHFEQIDFVFANAGINGVITPIEDMKSEEWDKTISINLKGTFLTVKYAIPYMKKNGGSIAITSSINGNRYFKNFGYSAYSSSKAAQVAFGKMAALELAQYKIRVNMICPGAIDTNINDSTFKENEALKKITIPIEYPQGSQPLAHHAGTAEQVSNLVLFLASNLCLLILPEQKYILMELNRCSNPYKKAQIAK